MILRIHLKRKLDYAVFSVLPVTKEAPASLDAVKCFGQLNHCREAFFNVEGDFKEMVTFFLWRIHRVFFLSGKYIRSYHRLKIQWS